MILHAYIKQCKKCDFYLERGAFYNVVGDRVTKWSIAKKP
jgi:hypothetical protein